MNRKLRTVCFFALVYAAASSGCHSAERSGTCAPISGATRVLIRVSAQGPIPTSDYVITDSERIHQLIAFANARRDGSQPSLYTMPAAKATAAFYDEADFLGAIGAGPNFFFVSCPNWKGTRSATDAEVGEFKRLVGSSK